jgi:hypothetical protein
MLTTIIVYLFFLFCYTAFFILKTKYPAKGIKSVKNIFKKKMSFNEAINELKNGNRIKRLTEYHGFLKMTKEAAGYKEEVYARYKVSDSNLKEEQIYFSLEDVLAEDWIIDD